MPARAVVPATPILRTPARANAEAISKDNSPARDVPVLRHLANVLDDLERTRKAIGNRIGAAERDYGGAFPHLDEIYRGLAHLEHQAQLELCREWRKHPLAPWAKEYRGVGEKTIARLIAATGDPAERPNVAKLWAYCGHGNPERKRRTGMTQAEAFRLGNPVAKTRTYLISASMLKAGNRVYYDARRAKTADRDWTDGHKHADALRYQGKMFLRDLWVAARAGHHHVEAPSTTARAGHGRTETHTSLARAGHGRPDTQNPDARAGHDGSAA